MENYITAKEFFLYMDGFRKEFNKKIDEVVAINNKTNDNFVDFEKGKLTGLLVTSEKQSAQIEALKTALNTSQTLEDVKFEPTKKVVDKVIEIIGTVILMSTLGLILQKIGIIQILH